MRRALPLIVAAVVAVALSAPVGAGAAGHSAQGADWAQLGFVPSHTDYNPFEKVLSPANVARLRLAWSYRGGATVSPVEADGVVFAGTGGGVLASDASTGKHLWGFSISGADEDGLDAAPAVVGGVVYIGDVDANFFAIDASTGQKLWTNCCDLGYAPSSAAVTGGVVYVASESGVDALQASNGHDLWHHAIGAPSCCLPVSSPAVAGGVVYYDSGQTMYALQASNGHKLWSYDTGGPIQSSPAVTRGADGVVYFGAGYRVYALRASNGHKLWSYRAAPKLSTLPAVARGVVYLGLAGRVDALRASNGHKLWSYRTGNSASSSPSIANGVVYFVSGLYVDALRASNGRKLWSSKGSGGGGPPVVANSRLYVSGGSKVRAFALPANQTSQSAP